MKCWLATWILLASANSLAAQQAGPEGKPFDPPAGGALWKHEMTGLAFPARLGDLRMEGGFVYKTPELGLSLRYVDKNLRGRADVYVYPCARPHGDGKEIRAALVAEARAVLDELDGMRRVGRYADVTNDDANVDDFELTSGEKSGRLTMPLHLTLNDDAGAGTVPTRVDSVLGLMIYRGFWVKLRYTLPAELGGKGDEAREKFVKQAFRCVMAADMGAQLRRWIDGYRKDRLGREAADQAGGIVVYADEFPLVELTVGQAVTEFGAACESRFHGATLHVLRAFVVGATAATVEGGTQAEVVVAGAREVSALCNVWRKADPAFSPPSLLDFEAAVLKENKVVPPAGTTASEIRPKSK